MLLRAAVVVLAALTGLALYSSDALGRFLVTGVLLLVAPGYLFWSIVRTDVRLPRLVAPALWLALSLGLFPVLFLWSSMVGLRLTPPVLRLLALGLVLASFWQLARQPLRFRSPLWLVLAFSFVLSLVALTRVLAIRGIMLPLWVDSLLVRIVGETGQLPMSLRPYLPVDDLPYHWGYHVVIAAWQGVADIPLPETMLWSGQVLNSCSMPVLYAVGAYMLRSPRAGLLSASVVGLFSLMPAYFVTWGRYTQLTGLLLLPGLLIVSMVFLERPTFSWRLLIAAALLLSGLFLIHYRVVFFYTAFMAPYGALLLLRRPGQRVGRLLRGLALGILTLLLCGPWVVFLAQRILIPIVAEPARLAGSAGYNRMEWALLWSSSNPILIGLAGAGALLACIARNWRVIAVASWVVVMAVIANPGLLGLPSSWLINNHAMIISLFLPIGILTAYFVNAVLRRTWLWLPQTRRRPASYAAAGTFGALALLGAWQLHDVVNPVTVLATPADMRAISWITQRVPPDARFLVNSTHWQNGSPRGTDAGWWLLPLTGRWVSTPPALYIYGDPAYKQAVERSQQRLNTRGTATLEQVKRTVREAQISHVFIGKQGGPLRPDVLQADPWFVPIYQQDDVWVFEVYAPTSLTPGIGKSVMSTIEHQ